MSEEYLRSALAARFAPYQPSDRILVTSVRGITRVEYGPPVHSLDVTRFHARFDGQEAHLYALSIEPRLRGQGHGRALYAVVEDLADFYGARTMTLEPIADGDTFWPHLGFCNLDEDMMIKELFARRQVA